MPGGLKTPDFTPEAIVAWAAAVITALVTLFGLDITDAQKAAALSLIGSIVVAFQLIHSAVVRNGRAKAAGEAAKAPLPPA